MHRLQLYIATTDSSILRDKLFTAYHHMPVTEITKVQSENPQDVFSVMPNCYMVFSSGGRYQKPSPQP